MIRSGRTVRDCSPGDRLSLCRRWMDPDADFQDVVVVEQRGARVAVKVSSGPESGEIVSVYASALWSADQLDHARERRDRDLQIDKLNSEDPVDEVTWLAVEICCLLATGDIAVEQLDVARTVLRRLGRSDRLDELHELAYAEDDWQSATVHAPARAWCDLFASFAKTESALVEQRAADETAEWTWVSPPRRAAALAVVRGWAGLTPVARPVKWEAAPRGVTDGARIGAAIRRVASKSVEGSRASGTLKELREAYLQARDDLDAKEVPVARQLRAPDAIQNYVDGLIEDAGEASARWMERLLSEAGIRTALCDHIVWSDYSGQHPRTLHLFPDGHLYPEEDGVSRHTPYALTACGRPVVLSWRNRNTWQRAYRGEWLEHYQSLQQYRADVWRRETEGEINASYFAAGRDEARRICDECAGLHGLFLECLEKEDDQPLWPPWRSAEIRQAAKAHLYDQLRHGHAVKDLKRARVLAHGARVRAEVEATAREAKRRGPGPLRRLFGDREPRSPSVYEQWASLCEAVDLEPHELVSRTLWERLLAESLADRVASEDEDGKEPVDFRAAVRAVVEARLAGFA
jgi:hypothetical protein